MKLKKVMRWAMFAGAMIVANAGWTAPTVLTMPDGVRAGGTDTAYAWAGKAITFWGRVIWDTSTTGNYTLDCGNGVTTSGAVTTPDSIGMSCTYATANTYFATLTVTDGNAETATGTTRIDVIPVIDLNAEINLAIERGLKYMYDRYVALGKSGWIYDSTGYGATEASTAAAVLAFENRGHLPGLNAAERLAKESSEVYGELVHRALDNIVSTLGSQAISVQAAGDPDVNGNGIGLYDPSSYPTYTNGMVMMALVGAGESDGVAATPDAGSIVATTGGTNVLGRTYHDIVQDMADWCSWAQVEPSRGVYRGGWRYSANYSSSDNSVSQWCPLGMDEATIQWGIQSPAFVLAENAFWTTYSQVATTGCFGYTSAYNGSRILTAAGLAQLFFQGNDASSTTAASAVGCLNTYWTVASNMYELYGVTKAMRMARDPADPTERKTVDFIGAHDWYAEYARYLIDRQATNGSWYGTVGGYTSTYMFNTAWAVEILTPALTGQPPVAVAGGPYSTAPNQNVLVDGSASYHEDPAKFLTLCEWDLDNDGTYDVSTAWPTCTATAGPFPETGSDYNVTVVLRVTDNVGDTDTDAAIIQVTSGNIAPVADPGGPYFGAVGQTITLDGSGSTDANAGEPVCGDIVKYEWDLDGNGTFETPSVPISSPTLDYSWSTAFSGNIGLRVEDDCGAFGTSSVFADIAITDVQQIEPATDAYQLVRVTRLSRVLYEYEFKLTMTNVGTATATNVTMDLITTPGNVTVVDGQLSFGDIGPGDVVQSTDTATIRADRSIMTSPTDLEWRLTYGDNGTTYDLVIPWLP